MNMIDILPALCSRLASVGGVALLCQKLGNVESLELLENVVKTLDKVAQENPYAVLAGQALMYLPQLLDFFDFSMQVRVRMTDRKWC